MRPPGRQLVSGWAQSRRACVRPRRRVSQSPAVGSGRIEIIRKELSALGGGIVSVSAQGVATQEVIRPLNGFPPLIAHARSRSRALVGPVGRVPSLPKLAAPLGRAELIGRQPDDRPGTTLELDAPRQPEHAVVPADSRVLSGSEGSRADRPADAPGRFARLVFRLGRHSWALTAALCALVDFAGVRGVDMAAQDYRVWAFRTHGIMLWDVNWYAGHTDVGYSLLFPALGGLIGAMPATALAATCSTWLFGRLVQGVGGWPSALAQLWFAAFAAADVVIGRGPFACALTFGLLAVVATHAQDHSFIAGVSALVASLFSPLGAMFLLIAAAAWARTLVGDARCRFSPAATAS